MKLNRSLIAHGVIATIALTGFAIARQDGGGGGGGQAAHDPGSMEMPDMGAFKMILGDKPMGDPMQLMADLGTPGEPHQFLKKMAGKWDATMRMWMDPSMPPMESHGQAWTEPVMGGRFMQHKLAIAFMGQPYEGLGYIGFDNNRRMFVNSYIDSMSTSMSFSKGSINREGDQITMFGEMDEPSTGEVGKVAKFVYRFEGEDKMFFEAWEVMYGEPWKVFEVEYKRKKAKP